MCFVCTLYVHAGEHRTLSRLPYPYQHYFCAQILETVLTFLSVLTFFLFLSREGPLTGKKKLDIGRMMLRKL